jgi:hypothetical protein
MNYFIEPIKFTIFSWVENNELKTYIKEKTKDIQLHNKVWTTKTRLTRNWIIFMEIKTTKYCVLSTWLSKAVSAQRKHW